MLLDIKREAASGGVTVLKLTGRITLGNSCQELEWEFDKLLQGGCCRVVLDLSGVERLDSSGIGILALSAGKLRSAGGQLRVTGAHGIVAEVVKLAKLDTIMPFDPDVESALGSFGAAAGQA